MAKSLEKNTSNKYPLIWLMVSIAIICCIITVAGGYFWFKPSTLSSQLTKCDPIRSVPTAQPFARPQSVATTPISITALDDPLADYPSIRDLVTSDTPTTWPHIFRLTIKSNKSVEVSVGWCASSELVLNENLQHIQFLLEADGKPIDVKNLHRNEITLASQYCLGYVGLIKKWTEGSHVIIRTIIINQDIDNGLICNPKGEYSEVFLVTVEP